MIEEIIKELLENNISVELELYGNKIAYKVSGFYKSDTVLLVPEEESITCIARYAEEDNVYNIEDLLYINKKWWERSKDRYAGWINPDSNWVNLYIKYGILKKVTKEVTEYQYV